MNCRHLATLALLTVAITSPCFAQTATEPPPQAVEPTEPAPAPTPAAAPTTATISASPEVLEEARKHFLQGVAYASSGNCEGAVVEFEMAYKFVPRPNALYNIAQCEERLFRYDLAIEYYERYLKEAPEDAADRPAVQAALGTLRNLLGVLHVESNVPAEVWIDDRLSGNSPGKVYVPAGGHSIELRADKYIPARSEFRIVGREEQSISLELSKAQTTVNVTETTGLSPIVFWIGASATVVTAAVGGIFALQVSSLHAEAEKIPAQHPDRAAKKKDIESAELTADIFFGSAALLAVGTTVIGFLTDWNADTRPADGEVDAPSARITPVVAPGYAGLSLGGAL